MLNDIPSHTSLHLLHVPFPAVSVSISFPISARMAYLVRLRRRRGNGRTGSLDQVGDRGICCLQRGLAENRTPGAAGGLGFCSPRKRTDRRGKQQSQGSFFCWTPVTGGRRQLRQSTGQPCPKGKTEGASGWLFKCSCYITEISPARRDS